jgi:hypothetical protein
VATSKDALYFRVLSLLVVENPLDKARSSGRRQDLADTGYVADVGAQAQREGELPQESLSQHLGLHLSLVLRLHMLSLLGGCESWARCWCVKCDQWHISIM